jgi:carbon storage regulator CsrA
MLVLSRKPGESITIEIPPSTEARTIQVTLCVLQGGKARLGIEADESIGISRTELSAGVPQAPESGLVGRAA